MFDSDAIDLIGADIVTPGIATSSTERRALAGVTARTPSRADLWRWRVATIVAGATAILAIAFAIYQNRRAADLASARSGAVAVADSLAREVETRDALLTERTDLETLLPMLASDRPSLALSGAGATTAKLHAGSDEALFAVDGLTPLDGDRTYILWLETDAGFRRLVDLGSAPDSHLFVTLDDVSFLAGWGALTVTAEPAPVGTQPSTEAVLEYRGWLR